MIFFKRILLLAVIIMSFSVSGLCQKNEGIINTQITGTWVGMGIKRWKLVFKANMECYEYGLDVHPTIYQYKVTTGHVECEEKIDSADTEKISYLNLKNTVNGKTDCYEIEELNSKILSIRMLYLPQASTFKRVKDSKVQKKSGY
ncbi:hypothetical protein [Asinibacterium sp. OR53]|uniref:hypothetical protein n=1 Tax=Asinibacterium sp. OR53 TaxID=925409 RepID=UPI00047C84BE|nr:hypothetical protein [Asinibacterium sp. OR53]